MNDASPPAFWRPNSLEGATVAAVPPVTLARAGGELDAVRSLEEEVRYAWWLLATDASPPDGRACRASRAAARLVDGPHSRLARALRRQALPWHMEESPLKETAVAAVRLIVWLKELQKVSERRRELQYDLADLRARYAEQFPQRWAECMALDRACNAEAWIGSAATREELEAFAGILRSARDALARWEREIREWLTAEGGEDLGGVVIPSRAAPTPAPGDAGAKLPSAKLEARYELLLRLGSADRAPTQARNAHALRTAIMRRVKELARDVRIGEGDALLRTVRQLTQSETAAALSADELWIYGQAFARYGLPADPPAGDT